MFLKNKNIIFKIRRSKVTDYAALSDLLSTARKHRSHLKAVSNESGDLQPYSCKVSQL